MLAYNQRGYLEEYEDTAYLKVCNSCHHIYLQILSEQIPGCREREEDICPYCNAVNETSMLVDYSNSRLTPARARDLRRKRLLIDEVINYCHGQYLQAGCSNCNHIDACPNRECQGNCKYCLEEVHYPGRYSSGKTDYDCDRMINFYVCCYSYKYTSEMIYLMCQSEALKNLEQYHVMSIGCGACPDLMAFEIFCHARGNKSVQYYGIDINERWKPIHELINNYRTNTVKATEFRYFDAVADSSKLKKDDTNVIILQYVISHFYNTGQIQLIEDFFGKLVELVVSRKKEEKPLVILINDVNSINRGRELFKKLLCKLQDAGFHGIHHGFYFDYRIQNDGQKYGSRHNTCRVLLESPDEFEKIYQPWHVCSSAQLLIEVQ